MTDKLKPMLATEAKEIPFPVYASPKIDGIRAIVLNGVPVSRTLKPIPNTFCQDFFSDKSYLNGLDGELVVGEANHPNAMQATTSGLMSRAGCPEFTFWVFDYWTAPKLPYKARLENLQAFFQSGYGGDGARVRLLEQVLINNQEELEQYEAEQLEKGFEGVIVRAVNGLYKYGRSTAREGYLLKVKRFQDGEAVVVGFNELMRNDNEAEINVLGYIERSSHTENLTPMGVMGSLEVEDLVTGVRFSVGTGYTMQQRSELWAVRNELVGKIVKYKHFPIGVKDAPRFPVYLGFRDPNDMG